MVSTPEKVESKAGSPPGSLPQVAQKAWTDKAFMALPDDGNRYELVNGELVVMGAAGARHGYFVTLISFFLTAYARERKAGFVFDSDTSFTMASGNRRPPDCSFFSKERMKSLGGIPQQVGIWFDAQTAPFIRERRWHPTQVIEEEPDGSLVFRMTVQGMNDMKRWVLGYGKGAVVRDPPDLVGVIGHDTGQIFELYH